MHPGIEKLENLFSEARNKKASFDSFFDELWAIGGTLPRPEMHALVERVNEYIVQEKPIELRYIAYSLLGLGFVLFHEGKYEKSILTLAETQKAFSNINDEEGVQCAATLMGCDYRTIGEMEIALNYLFGSYEYLSKVGKKVIFQGFSVYNLAEIYSETGQYDEAIRFHEISLKLCISVGSRHMEARIYNGIGDVYMHQKRYALALDYLTKSLNLSEELKNLPVKARALTDLGLYYVETGDFDKAVKNNEEALSIRNDLKIPGGAITNMIHLAEIWVKQNKTGEAIEMLEKALKIAEEIKVKTKMFQIHLMLSDIFQAKGDLPKSLFHYKAYHAIREEVQHEDNEKKIKNQKLIFEAEQTKKENAIIKAQKEEIETKNKQLQETIEELTITKISRKAKALTLVVGIALIIAEDPLMNYVLHKIGEEKVILSIAAKVLIILSLKPIDSAIENYLLKRFIINRRKHQQVTPQ